MYTNDGHTNGRSNYHDTTGRHTAKWLAAVYHHRAVEQRSRRRRTHCVKCDDKQAIRYGTVLADLPRHRDTMYSDRSFVRIDPLRKRNRTLNRVGVRSLYCLIHILRLRKCRKTKCPSAWIRSYTLQAPFMVGEKPDTDFVSIVYDPLLQGVPFCAILYTPVRVLRGKAWTHEYSQHIIHTRRISHGNKTDRRTYAYPPVAAV